MNDETVKILVAEADMSICEIIKLGAIDQGWAIDEARDGISAIKLLRRKAYQLIILSCELPVIDGGIVLQLTQEQVRCPVIFIGKSGAEEDRLAAFEAGGNDYLQKPFFPRELLARMRNLMRLYGTYYQKRDELKAGPVRIERHSRSAFVSDSRLELTSREYNLLLELCSNPGRAFSRDSLLNSAWGSSFEGGDRTVDTHIKSLRKKLSPFQDCIKTVWGYGYKFEE
ncbi:MAG: response regulator transcription factor [Clostridiales bacterium]|nr:response regulator transcription factor [Clostridiales bacterium]